MLFLICICPLFISSTFVYFAPFLAIVFTRADLKTTLLWALASGLVIDFLSSQTPVGLYALNYALVVFILYRLKSLFFEESWTGLPILSFCFSFLSSLFYLIFYLFMDHSLKFSPGFFFFHLFITPFSDALYAIFAFSFPLFLLRQFAFYRRLKKRNR